MKSFFPHQRREFWQRVVPSLLLMFFFIACNMEGKGTPSHASSSRTTIPAPSTGQGANTAVVDTIPLPGSPFKAVSTNNGQWLFVSLDSNDAASNGIAVLHNVDGQISLQRVIPLVEQPLGLTLTHDDSLLLVAALTDVIFVNVAQAESGGQNAIAGSVLEQSNPLAIEVILSQDERDAFVANENDGTVDVIDMQHIRAHDFSSNALVGMIPVNKGPLGVNSGAVGMAISPDNRYLYVTSRIDTGDPSPQGNTCFGFPPGTLTTVSIARAAHDPAKAVLSHAFAGCGPVRVILSPFGDTAWVSVQEDNAIKAFNTARLLRDPAHAQLTTTKVGMAPAGEVLVDNGTVLVVANTNRFLQPQTPQTLTVLDTKQALAGKPAILGTINVGVFPRELVLEANQQTLLLTNYNSNTLSIIDVAKLPH